MAYKSKYIPVHKDKYKGNPQKIVCRSNWERAFCKFLDRTKTVKWWCSEEIFVRYFCTTDNKWHRYFPDFIVEFDNGKTYMIEIKPEKQKNPPVPPKRKTRRYLKECKTWEKNKCKWIHANRFCKKNGWIFQVWTENELKKLGLRINGGKTKI